MNALEVATVTSAEGVAVPPILGADSLFERFPWFYAVWREHLLRDDTERIAAAPWPDAEPAPGERVLDLGCGTGFYSRRLAERFPQLHVTGVDWSARQLAHACAAARHIGNCAFTHASVFALPWEDRSVDAVIAARLFTVVSQPERALAEVYRVLRPGGRGFIAEPRRSVGAGLPLRLIWFAARVWTPRTCYPEPPSALFLSRQAFERIIQAEPWQYVAYQRDRRYQCARMTKAAEQAPYRVRWGSGERVEPGTADRGRAL